MFENSTPPSLSTIAGQYAKSSVYFGVVSFLIGAAMPRLTAEGQVNALGSLLEHSAPLTFNILGSFSLLALCSLLLATGRFTPASAAFRWLVVYPAKRTFELGSIASGMFLGIGLAAAVVWQNLDWASRGLEYATIIFALVTGFTKLYFLAVMPPPPLLAYESIVRGVLVLAILGAIASEYGAYFA